MMPVNFRETNINLVKPNSMTAEECEDLRGLIIHSFRGPQYTTCWAPSYEDVQNILSGKGIIVEMHTDEYIYFAIGTKLVPFPALQAQKHAVIWLPGTDEFEDIKAGKPIFITFVCDGFPVMSVYVKED